VVYEKSTHETDFTPFSGPRPVLSLPSSDFWNLPPPSSCGFRDMVGVAFDLFRRFFLDRTHRSSPALLVTPICSPKDLPGDPPPSSVLHKYLLDSVRIRLLPKLVDSRALS